MAKKKTAASDAAPSNAASTTAVALPSPGPSPAMLALFQHPENMPDVSKLKRRNMPKLVKPDEVPVGGVVSGEIIAICKSPSSVVKGLVLHIKHANGTEFTFPCTGTIRQALAPGLTNDDTKLREHLEKEIGKQFFARRLDDGATTKYGGTKRMFQFDVFTT